MTELINYDLFEQRRKTKLCKLINFIGRQYLDIPSHRSSTRSRLLWTVDSDYITEQDPWTGEFINHVLDSAVGDVYLEILEEEAWLKIDAIMKREETELWNKKVDDRLQKVLNE